MSEISITGLGAVSPAGWGRAELCEAVRQHLELTPRQIERPGWERPLPVRCVPPLKTPPTWARHPRFRRTSPISRFSAAAALEALGDDAAAVANGTIRLGVVMCVMAGCVNYSRRFYHEVLKDPSTASPLVFPETVFNAPASHLAALLGARLINYTIIGDDTAFVHGLVTAAGWLTESRVDGCLVIGAEEHDWLTADGMHLFDRNEILAEGAGAVYLKTGRHGAIIGNITSPQMYLSGLSRTSQVRKVREELESSAGGDALFDSLTQDQPRLNPESSVWSSWTGERISTRKTTGNAFNAGSAWQTIVAADMIMNTANQSAIVTVTGVNQEAIGLILENPGK